MLLPEKSVLFVIQLFESWSLESLQNISEEQIYNYEQNVMETNYWHQVTKLVLE